MNSKLSRPLVLFALLVAMATAAQAVNVTISGPNASISADTAANATSPAYTTLSSIVLTETATNDFASNGSAVTFTIQPPIGWAFNAGAGGVSASSGKDITTSPPASGPQISVTSSLATITYTCPSATKTDVLTISGLQIRPVDGYFPNANPGSGAGNITRAGGTASVAGAAAGTTLGTVTMTLGAAKTLAITTQPSATSTAGTAFASQPVVQIRDQFGNLRSADTTSVTAARNVGSASLTGTTAVAAVGGVVTYTNLGYNKAETMNINFTAAGLTTATSNNVVVSAAAPSALAFSTSPGSATAGAIFGTQPVIVTTDAYGNVTNAGLAASIPITIAINSGSGTLQGTTGWDIGSGSGNGTVSATDLRIDQAGNFTLSASGFGTAISGTFAVSPAAADHLVIGQQPPSTATAGIAFSPAVTVRVVDAFGNLRSADTPTINAARNTGSGTQALQGTTGVAAVAGVATFSNLSYNKAGETIQIDFTSATPLATSSTVTSNNVTVQAGAATSLQLTAPASAAAGTGFNATVTAYDAFSNVATGYTGTVAFSTTSTLKVLPANYTFTGADNGTHLFTGIQLNTVGSQTLSVTDGTRNASAPVSVGPGPAASYTISGTPASQTAGTAFNATVTVKDAYGNVATNYTGTATLSSSDPQAVTPANYTFTGGDAGVHAFSFTLKTAGLQSVTAQDTVNGSLTASANVTVNAANASQIIFQTQPGSATAGSPFGTQPVIWTADPYGNFSTGGLSANIPLTMSLFSGSGTLLGTASGNLGTSHGNGVVAFTNLQINASGSKVLQASCSVGNVNSNAFTVSPAAASKFAVTSVNGGTSPTAGAGFTLAVQSWDPYNNLSNVVANTPFSITLQTGTGTLGGTLTGQINAATSSTLVSGLTYTKAESGISLTVTRTGGDNLSAATSSTFTVVAAAASKFVVTSVNGGTNPTAGAGFTMTVQSRDPYDNPSNVSATTAFSISVNSGTPAALGGTASGSITSGTNVVTVSGITYTKAESGITLDVTRTSGDLLTAATSPSFTVDAAAPSKYVITSVNGGTNPTAGVAFGFNVETRDTFDNISPVTQNSKFQIALETGTGTLSGTGTGTVPNGSATLTVTGLSYNKAESGVSIRISRQTGNNLTDAVSPTFMVDPGPATKLAFTRQPAGAVAGSIFGTTPIVQSQDALGNKSVVGLGGSHNITMSLNLGTLQGTLTYDIVANAGQVDFSGLRIDQAGSGKILTVTGSPLTQAQSNSFTVSAAAPSIITKIAGDGQTAPAESTLPTDPSVKITDAYNNPISGISVTFAPQAGSGSVTGGAQTTNASGIATVTSWTLGQFAGTHYLDATGASLSTTFSATATCNYTTRTSGDWSSVNSWIGGCVPGGSDTAFIASGHTITVSGNTTVNAITYNSLSADSTINVNAGVTLGVNTNVLMNTPASNNVEAALNLSGILNVSGNVTLNGNNGNKDTTLHILSTGSAQIAGDLMFGATGVAQRLFMDAGATMYLRGDFEEGGDLTLDPTSSISFNGTSLQTIGTYHPNNWFGNVLIDNDVQMDPGPGAALPIAGTLTINSGKTFTADGNLFLHGDFVDDGTFVPGNGNVNVNGSAAQTFSGAADPIPFYNLIVNNAAGLTLATNITVSNLATLTSGIVTTNAQTMTILGTGDVTRTSGYVHGNLAKVYNAAALKVFEVGTPNGYSPVDVDATAGSFPATFVSKAVQGPHPNVPTPNALQRYWRIANGGVTNADLTFHYLASDVVGNEATYHVANYFLATWTLPPSTVDSTNHFGSAASLAQFGEFTLYSDVGLLDHFAVEAAGGGAISSHLMLENFGIDVTAKDPYGSTVTTFNGTVDLTSTGTLSTGSGTTPAFTAGVLSNRTMAISNTGTFTITATKTGGVETGTSNAFFVGGQPDVTISITGPNFVEPGVAKSFFVVVSNLGPVDASNVSVTFSKPAGWTATPLSTCAGFPCSLGTLPAHASVSFHVSVKPSAAAAVGSYTLTTSVTTTSTESDTTNNSSSKQTSISNCPTVENLQPSGSGEASGELTWDATRATSFDVYFGEEGTGCSTYAGTTDQPHFPYSDLEPGHTYEFHVVAYRDGCQPVVSECVTFSISCQIPRIMGVAETTTNSSYHVQWSEENPEGTYTLQEALSSDFSDATSTEVTGTSMQFVHEVSEPTAYYYRVHSTGGCTDGWSQTLRVVVQPLDGEDLTDFDLVIEHGVTGPLTQPIHLSEPEGFRAQAAGFLATTNAPWLTVTPSSGSLPPNGLTLDATVDPTSIPLGTSSATVTVRTTDGTLIRAFPVSVHAMSPIEQSGKTANGAGSSIVPTVGHAFGASSRWRSDVRIFNPAATASTYDLYFTPTRTDGTVSGARTQMTIEAGQTLALGDLVRRLFGFGSLGESGIGALEIRPVGGAPAPIVTSRTYNSTADGTYGQFIPAVPLSRFAGAGSVLSLQQVARSAKYRTNFGIVEGSGNGATAVVRIYDDGNQQLDEVPVTLAPFEQQQLDGILSKNGITIDDARLEVEVTSGQGSVAAYASVIDNLSNDPLAVSGVEPATIHERHYVVPGVANLDNGVNLWRSDLRIYNAADSSVNATLVLYPQDGAPSITRTISLPAHHVATYDNVVSTFFGATNAGGALHVFTATDSQLVVTARTYDDQADGTYGQFIPAVTMADAATLGGRTLQILHVDQSLRFRTNFGLAEIGGHAVHFEVTVTTADGATITRELDMGPYEFRQYGSFLRTLGLSDVSNARISIRVTGGEGAVVGYASNIDNRTQDPTYIPAQ